MHCVQKRVQRRRECRPGRPSPHATLRPPPARLPRVEGARRPPLQIRAVASGPRPCAMNWQRKWADGRREPPAAPYLVNTATKRTLCLHFTIPDAPCRGLTCKPWSAFFSAQPVETVPVRGDIQLAGIRRKFAEMRLPHPRPACTPLAATNVNQGFAMSQNLAPEVQHLLPIPEAAHRLTVSVRTLERLIASRQFPEPVRINRSRRVLLSDLNGYLEKITGARRS